MYEGGPNETLRSGGRGQGDGRPVGTTKGVERAGGEGGRTRRGEGWDEVRRKRREGGGRVAGSGGRGVWRLDRSYNIA